MAQIIAREWSHITLYTGRIMLNGTHNAQTFVFSGMKRAASNIKCSALNEAFCTDKKLRG